MAKRNVVDVQAITFGVEIECTLPTTAPVMVGSYHRGIEILAVGVPAGWTAEGDSSILGGEAVRGRRGVEIVSPILKGDDGISQLLTVMRWLNSIGARVSRRCGFHVHIGVGEMTDAQVGRIVRIVARHERALYACTGTRTREGGSNGHRYCQPIKNHPAYIEAFKDSNGECWGPEPVAAKFLVAQRAGRYRLLNITSHLNGTRPTLEFRVFSGTMKALKAVTFIRIAVGLVHKALVMTRAAKWDAEQKILGQGKGPGQQAVKVLVGELWNPSWNGAGAGRTPEGPYGVIGDRFTTDQCRSEAMRLAAKYDARTDEVSV